jgi:ribonuclease P protein component
MSSGKRITGDATVIYLKRDESLAQARFGFIVSKSVGGAVTRNVVKRRLRSIAREIMDFKSSGFEMVVRALPFAADADWNRLQKEVVDNVKTAFIK